MFHSTFFTLLWFVVAVHALPIQYDFKRDIYLTLPSSPKAATSSTGEVGLAGQSTLYTLGDGQMSTSPAYVSASSPIIMAQATTTAQDPKAVWSVPMIPSGQFSPMPNIVHHVISTIAIPQSQAEKPKEGEKKEGEPKPEETKPVEPKPEEAKPAEPKPEDPKPEEPKPEEAKPAEPKPEEPKKEDEAEPADPPKVRRSLRGLNARQVVKRQESGSGTCESEQFIVPVTYAELQGLNEGTLKLQRLGSESTTEEGCENADVIVAPVSDEQMEGIQAGTLQLVPLDEPGQVSLEPVEASSGGSDTAASGSETPESGPMFDVVPTASSLSDEEVQDVVQDFEAGKNLLDQQYQSEAGDVKNIAGSLKSQGKAIIGDDQDIHITLRRRDHMIYVERKPQSQGLAKRSVEGVYS